MLYDSFAIFFSSEKEAVNSNWCTTANIKVQNKWGKSKREKERLLFLRQNEANFF